MPRRRKGAFTDIPSSDRDDIPFTTFGRRKGARMKESRHVVEAPESNEGTNIPLQEVTASPYEALVATNIGV